MNVPKFRIKFDVPHSFAVEPGFFRANHCHDFKLLQDALNGVWWEPNTGLMMLRPSFLDEGWYEITNWITLADWLKDPDYWQEVALVSNPDTASTLLSAFYTTVLNAAAVGEDMPAYVSDSVLATLSLASIFSSDKIVWAAKSAVSLLKDEGFCWHYRAMGHPVHRIRNWFALQWDNLGFHFSFDGVCRVYLYGSDKTIAPTFLEQFEICSPGDIADRDGYFIFIPIAGY
jgi:hypothetical protein